MRVIAGSARRLRLKTPEGTNTRPTTDRIKETLFNILQPHVEGCVFLDLFSGSGGIGIEALSRGAKKAYLWNITERRQSSSGKIWNLPGCLRERWCCSRMFFLLWAASGKKRILFLWIHHMDRGWKSRCLPGFSEKRL